MLFMRISLLILIVLFNNIFAANTSDMVDNAIKKFASDVKSLNVDMKKIAVYKISTNNPQEIDSISIQDRLTNILLESQKFKVIDRSSLNALLKEQSLSLSGMVDNAAMVKAGKLIGVQGFFFGNMNVKNDKVYFTIKLIEVESSALIYSKTIIGESYSRVEVGFAAGFTMGTTFSSNYDIYDESWDEHKLIDQLSYPNQKMSAPQLTIFYIQGFNNLQNFKFGLNFSYTETDLIDDKYTSTNLDNGSSYGISYYSSLSRIIMEPMVYICPNAFGLNTNLFELTVGASIQLLNLPCDVDGWNHSGDHSFSTISVFPSFGIDLRPVKFIRLFVHTAYIPSDIILGDEANINGGDMSATIIAPTVHKGFMTNIGLGLSYTF